MDKIEEAFKAGTKFGLFWHSNSGVIFRPDLFDVWCNMYVNKRDEFEEKLEKLNHLFEQEKD